MCNMYRNNTYIYIYTLHCAQSSTISIYPMFYRVMNHMNQNANRFMIRGVPSKVTTYLSINAFRDFS